MEQTWAWTNVNIIQNKIADLLLPVFTRTWDVFWPSLQYAYRIIAAAGRLARDTGSQTCDEKLQYGEQEKQDAEPSSYWL